MDNKLTITGMVLNIIGSLLLVEFFIISDEEIIRLNVSRFSGSTHKEKLKLPAVRDKIIQRDNAICAGIFLFFGFVFQIIDQLL
ncbi:MAG: hypothetical protein WC283_02885 [Candidatus Paceibacterota bacterium]|jgi:hypothetical protein